MVATTIGMMKEIAEQEGNLLNPAALRRLVIHASSSSRYSDPATSPTTSESTFLGKDLSSSIINPFAMVGMRELNVLNSIVLAKNSSKYEAMVRVHNVDDYVWMSINSNWNPPAQQRAFGEDAIYGINGLSYGDTFDFFTYNAGTGSSYAYGYQVYEGTSPVYDSMGGVNYITGVANNYTASVGWHQGESFTY